MIDPSLEIVAAAMLRLKGFAAVTSMAGTRTYDAVPPNAMKPYISIAPTQVLPDRMGQDCESGARTSLTIHGWDTGPESVRIKRLGAAIVAALDEHELVLSGHRTVMCELEQVNYLDEPDGLTKHVAVTFQVSTEPT